MIDFVVMTWTPLAICGKALDILVLIPWSAVKEISERVVWQAPNDGTIHTWRLTFREKKDENKFREFARRRHSEASTQTT